MRLLLPMNPRRTSPRAEAETPCSGDASASESCRWIRWCDVDFEPVRGSPSLPRNGWSLWTSVHVEGDGCGSESLAARGPLCALRCSAAFMTALAKSSRALIALFRCPAGSRLSPQGKRSEGETTTDGRSKVVSVQIGDAGAMRNGDGQTAGHEGIRKSGKTVETLSEVMIHIERPLVEDAWAGTA